MIQCTYKEILTKTWFEVNGIIIKSVLGIMGGKKNRFKEGN